MGKGGEKLTEFPNKRLWVRSKAQGKAPKLHTRPVSDLDKPPLRSNNLDKVSRSLVKLHQFNTYLRRRERTETSSSQMGTATSTTRKDNSSRNRGTDGRFSTSSTHTSKQRLLKMLLSDHE